MFNILRHHEQMWHLYIKNCGSNSYFPPTGEYTYILGQFHNFEEAVEIIWRSYDAINLIRINVKHVNMFSRKYDEKIVETTSFITSLVIGLFKLWSLAHDWT